MRPPSRKDQTTRLIAAWKKGRPPEERDGPVEPCGFTNAACAYNCYQAISIAAALQ